MKVYKILHKPTGLFFTPYKGSSNLSKNGKIYSNIPNFIWRESTIRITIKNTGRLQKHQQIIVDYFKIRPHTAGGYWEDSYFECNANDWEIIEF